MSVTVAVTTHPPVYLDRARSLARARELAAEAAARGAALMLFPETWIPGYPVWVWQLRPGAERPLASRLHARLLAEAVDLEAGHLDPLLEAARTHRMLLAIGFHERPRGGGTLYNSMALIGPEGVLLHRRKLMPTHPERLVWGMGDGQGLATVPTPLGRIGMLICWENYMPLARYALYAQGLDLLLAPTWDFGELWIASLRHIAREGGCWVLGTATALRARDLPADLPERDRLFPDPEAWLNDGDAVVVRPTGRLHAPPLSRRAGILYADIDPDQAPRARRLLDVAGHYARPDIFRLEVDRRPRPAARFRDGDGASEA